ESGSGVNSKTFALTLDGAPSGSDCSVAGRNAFCLSPPLPNGRHSIEVVVLDWVGNRGSGSMQFDLVVERDPPAVTIQTPQTGVLVSTARLEVRGTASDDGQLASVQVGNLDANVSGGVFAATADLTEGRNLVWVLATDSFGRTGSAGTEVILDREPPMI